MSEYDSLKVISHPPFYRWIGLPDIFSCAVRLLGLCSISGSLKGGTFLINAGILLLLDLLTYTVLSSKKNGYIPTLTIRN